MAKVNHHSERFILLKNKDKSVEELRRRRNDSIIELRKNRKELNYERMRHMFDNFSFDDGGDEESDLTVEKIISIIKSSEGIEMPIKCIKEARRLISKNITIPVMNGHMTCDIPITHYFMSHDIFPGLIRSVMRYANPVESIYELISFLAQLTNDCKEYVLCEHIVQQKLIPFLISLLSYNHFGIIEQTLLLLSNIALSSIDMRDNVNDDGIVDSLHNFMSLYLMPLDSFASEPKMSVITFENRTLLMQRVTWTMSCLCHYPDLNTYLTFETFLPFYMKLLQYPDSTVAVNSLRALSFATDCDTNYYHTSDPLNYNIVRTVSTDHQLLSLIINFLSPLHNDSLSFTIRIICNIISCSETFAQNAIQLGVLTKFPDLLNHRDASIQREVAFAISNITAGNSAQIQVVINANLIQILIELLYLGDYKTQCEITHTLYNISAKGTRQQALYLMNLDNSIPNMNVFDAMATMLTVQDSNIIETSLKIYDNLFSISKKSGQMKAALKKFEISAVTDHLDMLQQHQNNSVSVLATQITEKYCSSDSLMEDEESHANVMSNGNDEIMYNF